PCRPGVTRQAIGERQPWRPRRGATGIESLAKGPRPGRHPRQRRFREIADRRTEGVHAALGRRGSAAAEGGGEREVIAVREARYAGRLHLSGADLLLDSSSDRWESGLGRGSRSLRTNGEVR